jgi:dTDP-4-dehydrorhamnose 3,5-epimerase
MIKEVREVQDKQTVRPDGVPVQQLPDGVSIRELPTQVDDRGWIVEMYDLRWDWHPKPLVYSYAFTIRPGMIKGWGMHKLHEDRYFILFGHLEIVLYDSRPDSPTSDLVSKVILSEYNRRLMNIPAGIWHANRNIGDEDVVVVNFPTLPYDHANPDKYRLPLDTDQIPYTFEDLGGW